jgi:DNA repair protein RadC
MGRASLNMDIGRAAVAMPVPPPRAVHDAQPRDRWLLMRLLAAGQSLPRLADKLIDERGSLGSVLSTSEERLRQLGADSNGIAMLGLLREAISAVMERGASEGPLVERSDALANAMHSEMAYLSIEQVRVAFLDAGHRLMRVEIMNSGSVRLAHIYPSEIARRCLELSASAVILVHNHPSGDPTPSAEDIRMTRRVRQALETIEVHLRDHLVIARKGFVSFAESGLL